MVPLHNSKGHFVSRFVFASVTIPLAPLSTIDDDKERLILAMQSVKEQYIDYLSNPCTPHILAEQMRLAPLRGDLSLAK